MLMSHSLKERRDKRERERDSDLSSNLFDIILVEMAIHHSWATAFGLLGTNMFMHYRHVITKL